MEAHGPGAAGVFLSDEGRSAVLFCRCLGRMEKGWCFDRLVRDCHHWANELLQPIHDRMPVILPEEAYKLWLDPRAHSSELTRLMVPFPGDAMKSHPVGSDVNYPKIDHDDLIRRVDVERGTTRSLF